MSIEKESYNEKRDFSQLLTDAALMNGASNGSASTQKFAIALSKDWIKDAYVDLVVKNRAAVPERISFEVSGYQDSTENGENEVASIRQFQDNVEANKNDKLKQVVEKKTGIYGGIGMAIIGLLMLVTGALSLIGIILIIMGGIWAYRTNNNNKKVQQQRIDIAEQYEQSKKDGATVIRQIMAEVVDFRDEFSQVDAESQQVVDFLDQLSPNQYIRNLNGSTRRVNVGGDN
ncbi:MAG TPA: hypothetical protein DCW31_11825 [Lactobacillus sp.]|nr:hypothetical protein [Lactobacillus sp.]